MGKFFGPLTMTDMVLGALLAFLITRLVLHIINLYEVFCKKDILSVNYKGVELSAIMEKCRSMFPIDTIYFGGGVFKRGMKIKVTTMQNKVIEGELVGKNKMDILCILTSQHIIAHELNKIQEIICIDAKV